MGHLAKKQIREGLSEGHWLREMAISDPVGEDECRYRVKVIGPKGMKVLHTGTFICRNHDHDHELPVPSEIRDLKIPSPTFEQAAKDPQIHVHVADERRFPAALPKTCADEAVVAIGRQAGAVTTTQGDTM